MSGFFIFRKKIYLKNKQKIFKKGYKILFDLITSKKNLSISDIDIKFLRRNKGQSKMSFKIIFILVFQIIFKLVKKKNEKKNYIFSSLFSLWWSRSLNIKTYTHQMNMKLIF